MAKDAITYMSDSTDHNPHHNLERRNLASIGLKDEEEGLIETRTKSVREYLLLKQLRGKSNVVRLH